MRFDSLKKRLFVSTSILREGYHNLNYDIPHDRLTALFDFYLANYPFGAGKQEPVIAYTDIAENIRTSFNEAKEKLIDSLTKELLEGVFFAICAEFRHVFSQSRSSSKKIENLLLSYGWSLQQIEEFNYLSEHITNKEATNIIKHRLPSETSNVIERKKAYSWLLSNMSQEKVVLTARDAFRDLSWNASFGGEPWATIADGWLALNRASTTGSKSSAIDHLLDLQHNNDTVLDKLKRYYKGGYDWLQDFLSFKKYITSPWQLYDRASPDMKTLAASMARITGEKSLIDWSAQFDKKKTDIYPMSKKMRLRVFDKDPLEWYESILDGQQSDYPLNDIKTFIQTYLTSLNWNKFSSNQFLNLVDAFPWFYLIWIANNRAKLDKKHEKFMEEFLESYGNKDFREFCKFAKEILPIDKYEKFIKPWYLDI